MPSVAEVKFTKAPSFVERNDAAEVIRIGAQPVDETVDLIGISREIAPKITEMCLEGESLSFQYKGYVAEAEESKKRTILGTVALLIAIYALLAIPLRSLTQPIFVMLVIPLGTIGALLGHILMGMTPSYLSIFGMLALAGISVNNSLVMVDYVNQRRAEGIPLLQAAMEAGARRFQPILLTSVTTFVGLAPMIFDRSLEAQFLIPMAVSMGFGILFTTVITLYLVPCALIFAALSQPNLVAIRPGATQDARQTHLSWQIRHGIPETSSLLYCQGRLYLMRDGGLLTCLKASTGTELFRERIGAPGQYIASPIVAGDKVIVASVPGVVTVIQVDDALKVLARNDFKESIFATPAVAENRIYLRTAGYLYALGE